MLEGLKNPGRAFLKLFKWDILYTTHIDKICVPNIADHKNAVSYDYSIGIAGTYWQNLPKIFYNVQLKHCMN